MAEAGPFGPFVPLGRRGPLRALAVLVLLAGAGAGGVLLLAGTSCPTDAFGPGSGDGRTAARPLLVDSTVALVAAADCPDRHLRQVADLEAPAPWTPLGTGSGGPFTGSYDGGGHTLTGLRVFLPGSDEVGAFGVLAGAEVRDLVLVDVVVEGRDRVGAIAGRIGPDSRVSDVAVRGARVRGGVDVGGLVGVAHPSAAISGTFDGTVDAVTGDATGPGPAPLVGRVEDGTDAG